MAQRCHLDSSRGGPNIGTAPRRINAGGSSRRSQILQDLQADGPHAGKVATEGY
jgi:hypothetical protein